MPAYAGTPVSVETPGAMSKCTLDRLRAAASVCSAPSSSGSPENRRTTDWPAFAASATTLARASVAQRQPVGVEGGTDVGLGPGEPAREVDDVDVGDDHVGLAQQRGRAERQQVGVARTGRDERDGAEGLLAGAGRAGAHCASNHGTRRPGAPAARRSSASSRPTPSASPAEPVTDVRTWERPSLLTTAPVRCTSTSSPTPVTVA